MYIRMSCGFDNMTVVYGDYHCHR